MPRNERTPPPPALTEAPVHWLAASAFLSLAALLGAAPAAWAQPSGWRAAAAPLALVLAEAVAAVWLLTGRGGGWLRLRHSRCRHSR